MFTQNPAQTYGALLLCALRSCCKIPRTDDVIDKCTKDILTVKPNEPQHMKRIRDSKLALHVCIAECEFKVKNYLKSTDEVDMAVITTDLKQRHAHDMDYVQLILKGMDKCMEFARNKTRDTEWLKSPGDCNFFPATLLACATEHVYERCPAQKWHATPKCEEMRNFLQKCDELEQT